jgi:hypothetical protein
MSEKDTRNIQQRMLAVMADVGYIQKEDKKVNNQYTFVSHDAVVAKTREAFIKHGIMVVSSVKEHSDYIEGDYLGHGVDPQDKGPGKATSYAKKYAILTALLLETGDDPERDSIEHETDEQRQKREAEEARAKERKAIADAWKPYQQLINMHKDKHPEIANKEKFQSARDSLGEDSPDLDTVEAAWQACADEMMEAIKAKEAT